MFKRIIPQVLALALLLMIAGCGQSDSSKEAAPAQPAASGGSTSGSSSGASSGNSTGGTQTAKSTSGSSSSSPSLMDRITGKPVILVIPVGTIITVRLNDSVGSKISSPGDPFSATVADAISVDGKVAIPEGSIATGTVVDAQPLGKFKGGARLQLRLDSVKANGSSYHLETASVNKAIKGKGKRSAVLIGGGAGAGALIGALAGGGKGAAIGAAVGAGAGTAGAAYTGNKEILLPAEAALSFKTLEPVEIKQ